ncbi:hypothetical protein HYW75_02620 [Candidatus Pacearchaeota archaeon]|nr:hypothetical protein [Candidatus Pacearchaeota archaeon]
MSKTIKTSLGEFDKEKITALINVRSLVLDHIRRYFRKSNFTEVTTSSLVNIAGSCENPYASFPVNYYGKEAHLSQSAQLQLEALVLRLRRPFYTINNSFREEHYNDPEQAGRRLTEFTLIESEWPLDKKSTPEQGLNDVIETQIDTIVYGLGGETRKLTSLAFDTFCYRENPKLNINWEYLVNVLVQLDRGRSKPLNVINYDGALELLNEQGYNHKFGDDLGIKEERLILKHFDNLPVFVTHFPASLKFFNLKRTPDGLRTYSVDLLLPPLGETIGGGVREENIDTLKQQYIESRVANYLREKGRDPIAPFSEYFSIFEQEAPLLRAGYGLGFERFIGFLLNSNDILNTIAYRTLQPGGRT